MQFDLFNILGFESAFTLLFGLWLLLYSFLPGIFDGARWFSCAYLAWGICCLLTAARGILPDALTLVAAHFLLAAGMASFHEGLLRLLRAPRNWPGIGLALTTAETISAIVFGLLGDDLQTRIIISSLVMCSFSLLGLAQLFRHTPASGPTTVHLHLTTALLGLVILSSSIRIALNVLTPLATNGIYAGALHASPHMAYLVFLVGSALNLIWMSLGHGTGRALTETKS
ncbi:MAG: hypothetical protein KKE73_08995 [Proteobacteria bacterium]|nr:hypothetical protein [Pseudomonadota bacterium]